jgi:hypothetical protein
MQSIATSFCSQPKLSYFFFFLQFEVAIACGGCTEEVKDPFVLFYRTKRVIGA